jgi:hypothetical protein
MTFAGRTVLAAVAAAALLGLGASYVVLFVLPERRPETAAPADPETLTLTTASGSVEIAGPDGRWQPARPGAHLPAQARIRTGDEGAAELRAADGSTVRLQPATEARVAELRRELKRLYLGAGMLEADVRDDPARVFEVELDDGNGVARTRGASFAATANGRGGAAVAARHGEVVLSSRGKEVVIRSGQFARLRPGEAPEAPQPIPASLFLKVAWPSSARTHAARVEGATAPGARVRIEGKYVPVDAEGRYGTDFELADGVHQLRIHAVDVGGHVVDEESPRIVIDTSTDFKVQRPKWK